MRLLGKPLKDITQEDIIYHKDNQVSESITLDYKRELPGNSDNDKKEFLADISSFVNTSGGVIIFGIEEEKDENGKNTGYPKEVTGLGSINIDKEKQRLEAIIREGLDPKLNNINIQQLEVDGKLILMIGITRSLFAPHMVSYKKSSRFFYRNNSGKQQMDARELKQSFLQTDEWERKADIFRRERIMDVLSLNIIPNLEIEESFFMHILPLGYKREYLDLKIHKEKLYTALDTEYYTSCNIRFNFDGLLFFQAGEKCGSYIQFFRNGGVEIYLAPFTIQKIEGGPTILYGDDLERLIIGHISKYLSLTSELGIEAPFIVYLALIGLKGIYLKDSKLIYSSSYKFDRDEILLPGIFLENSKDDVPTLMQPFLDMFWQAAGWNGSPNYKR